MSYSRGSQSRGSRTVSSRGSRSQYSQPQPVVYPEDVETGADAWSSGELPPPVTRAPAVQTVQSQDSMADSWSSDDGGEVPPPVRAASRQSSHPSQYDDEDVIDVPEEPEAFDDDYVPVRYDDPEEPEDMANVLPPNNNAASTTSSAYQNRIPAQSYSDDEEGDWENERWEEETDGLDTEPDVINNVLHQATETYSNEGETDEDDDWDSQPAPNEEQEEATELDPVLMDQQQQPQQDDQEKAVVSDTPNTKGLAKNANLFLLSAAVFFTVSLVCSILAIIFRDAKA